MRTIAVTGSASGICAATAARLERDGCRVIRVDWKGGDVVADLGTVPGRAAAVEGVRRLAGDALDGLVSGAGLDRFRRMVARQGGDPAVVDRPSVLALAPGREMVRAPRAGYVTGLDAMLIGRAAAALGAGRATAEDTIDHGVGIRILVSLGSLVRAGEPALELIHRDGRGLR